MNLARRFLIYIYCMCAWLSASSQRNARIEAYVERFAPVAVAEMRARGVPASITLAQGILESGAGASDLAVKGNNHFGIKTGGDWTGPYMLKDDDAPGERFRVYADAAESYVDHSLFLKGRSRYASLFTLPITDYKGWARGLKAAGYATSPTYADRLINIIETYDLARFDRTASSVQPAPTVLPSSAPQANAPAPSASTERIYRQNGAYYLLARPGDTYRAIGKRWGVRQGSLRRYNEQRRGYEPRPGERVFLSKKPLRAEKRYKGFYHTVRTGETLHAIAQAYAMRTRTLYRLNRLSDNYVPRVGDRLRVR